VAMYLLLIVLIFFQGRETEKSHRSLGEVCFLLLCLYAFLLMPALKVRINLADFAKDVDASGKTYQLTETLVKKKADALKV